MSVEIAMAMRSSFGFGSLGSTSGGACGSLQPAADHSGGEEPEGQRDGAHDDAERSGSLELAGGAVLEEQDRERSGVATGQQDHGADLPDRVVEGQDRDGGHGGADQGDRDVPQAAQRPGATRAGG